MNDNFSQFNAEATEIKTKEVNGLTLVWSPEDGRFVLPMPEPEKAKFKLLFDEPTGNFIQVLINTPDFFYRDRKATSPDGSVFQERIFIGRDKQGQTVEIPDPDFQKALIEAKLLEVKKSALDLLGSSTALFFIGVLVSLVAFFWQVISNVGVVAASFSTGSAAAMAEAGYYLTWVVGLLIGGFILRFTVPLLFKIKTHDYTPGQATGGDQTTATNIVVNNIQGGGSSAQDLVNGRRL